MLTKELTLSEISDIIEGQIVCGNKDSQFPAEVKACASDLMSDVLTLDSHKLILITGLNNLQTIRTAEMAEINTIIYVRNKIPNEAMIELAKEVDINLILSSKSMYHVCGALFQAGIKPVY